MLPTFSMIPGAPQPVAPFSHVVEANGFLFVTGQMPTYPGEADRPLPDGVEEQTKRVMQNLEIVLEGVGLSLRDVLQARVFLTHFQRDYEAMNRVYTSYFAENRLPARTCVGVTGLAKDALVEIDLVALRATKT